MKEKSLSTFFLRIKAILVSVILPVKNAQNTIPSAVNSILQQTYKSLELIIIDDNSSDNSIDLLSSIDDDRVMTIANKGKRKIADYLSTQHMVVSKDYLFMS